VPVVGLLPKTPGSPRSLLESQRQREPSSVSFGTVVVFSLDVSKPKLPPERRLPEGLHAKGSSLVEGASADRQKFRPCRIFLAGMPPSERAVLLCVGVRDYCGVCEATQEKAPELRQPPEPPCPYVSASRVTCTARGRPLRRSRAAPAALS
jgi:hypothetical protein